MQTHTGLSSKEWNANSGLYYYLYRFYDPVLQRWPNRDPLGEFGSEIARRHIAKGMHTRTGVAELAQGSNLYGFVHNFPVIKVDLFGLQTAGGFPVEPNQPVYPNGNNGPNNTDPEAPEDPDEGLRDNGLVGNVVNTCILIGNCVKCVVNFFNFPSYPTPPFPSAPLQLDVQFACK